MDLTNTTCLVTGGAGFIGSHIVDALLAERAKRIVVIDNLSRGQEVNLKSALALKNVELIKGDITNRAFLESVFPDVDIVFHQAALRITQCAQNPTLCHDGMVNGTFNVLNVSVKRKVKKFIFASTAAVYGEPEYVPMDENHPLHANTMYGAAKIASEKEIIAYHAMFDLPYVILRYFNAYGPRMDIASKYTEVLIRWLDAIEQGNPPLIHGDGAMSMDWVYVEDIARANILAAKADLLEGIFNIGTQTSTSLKELAEVLIRLMSKERSIKPIFKNMENRPHVSRRLANIEKAKKDLGFGPKVGLEEGLKNLIEWKRSM